MSGNSCIWSNLPSPVFFVNMNANICVFPGDVLVYFSHLPFWHFELDSSFSADANWRSLAPRLKKVRKSYNFHFALKRNGSKNNKCTADRQLDKKGEDGCRRPPSCRFEWGSWSWQFFRWGGGESIKYSKSITYRIKCQNQIDHGSSKTFKKKQLVKSGKLWNAIFCVSWIKILDSNICLNAFVFCLKRIILWRKICI